MYIFCIIFVIFVKEDLFIDVIEWEIIVNRIFFKNKLRVCLDMLNILFLLRLVYI